MEELHFQIHYHDGRDEKSVVQNARTIIGSGAHCDVRLSPDQAAFEHVVIERVADGGFRLEHLAANPSTTLDGVVLVNIASLPAAPARSTLVIGNTTLYIERKAKAQAASSRMGLGVLAKGSLLTLLLCSIGFIANLPKPEPDGPPSALPELFPAHEVTCPRSDPEQARAVADESYGIGLGARERSPFEAQEAIAAVKAYDLAAACYRTAGDGSAADDLHAAAREIETDTRVQLRSRRVRLERMLAVKDDEIARQDVAVLRALTEGQRGDYVTWLAMVEQDLKNRKVEKK